MEGFKILKSSNESVIKHIRVKCRKTNKEFLIRLEREQGAWYMVLATKMEECHTSSMPISTSELKFDNGLFAGVDYSCPYCGDTSIVRCGDCGKITCNDSGKHFTCAYCNQSGEISGNIEFADTEQFNQKAKK